MKRYNGTDYDIMYPKTLTEQVINGQRQIIVDSVTIGTSWTGSGPYTQTVTVENADANSKVDIQADATIIQKLIDAGTTALYIVNNDGVFSAVAVGAAPTEALDIQCTITKTAAPPAPALNSILNENSWSAIKWASKNNVGQNYWSVGDRKEVTMNGKVSDGLTLTDYTAWVYIIGFNHNTEKEGNGIAFQGFKTAQTGGTDICLVDSGYSNEKTTGTWFNMNNANTNVGGWQDSLMRKNVMPLIKASFPADLQAVIKTSTIFTAPNTGDIALTATEDEVFLLAEYEVFGVSTNASTQEPNYLKQYSYYSAGNSKVKYRHNATSSTAAWYVRSPVHGGNAMFCSVNVHGNTNYGYSDYSLCVAPCFKV
nr:MAG TPA: hypothetical protein [Caudoviricetes sp.]